jgi:hypothetical protein
LRSGRAAALANGAIVTSLLAFACGSHRAASDAGLDATSGGSAPLDATFVDAAADGAIGNADALSVTDGPPVSEAGAPTSPAAGVLTYQNDNARTDVYGSL